MSGPDFTKAELIPVIAQDDETSDVLMLAYMNEEAYQETLKTGRVCYFSRSRNKLWRKGEESGNVQELKSLYYDCDADTLLARVADLSPWLGWALNPGNLSQLSDTVRDEVRRLLLRQMIPSDADVSYQTKFLDDYMADDTEAIHQDASVHWGWTPTVPVYLFHGRGDQTVPFAASVSALNTLQAAGGAPVTLTECTEPVSDHLECVPQYFRFAVDTMARTSGQ